jgi:hypothetical protein
MVKVAKKKINSDKYFETEGVTFFLKTQFTRIRSHAYIQSPRPL